ncbi:ATP-binding protein [Salinispira pacifica]
MGFPAFVAELSRRLLDPVVHTPGPLESPRTTRERAFVGFILLLAPATVLLAAFDAAYGRWLLSALNILLFLFVGAIYFLTRRGAEETSTNLAFWGAVTLFAATSLLDRADSPVAREMTTAFVTSAATLSVVLIGLYARRKYQIVVMLTIAVAACAVWYVDAGPLTGQAVQLLVSQAAILALAGAVAFFECRLSRRAENQLKARRILVHQMEEIHYIDNATLSEMKRWYTAATHDVRNPVTVLANVLRLLSGSELSEQQRRYVEDAERACQSIVTIVTEGLIAPETASGIASARRQVDLRELLTDLVRAHRHDAIARGTTIELNHDAAPAVVEIPLADLIRVVDNLIGNSIRYTEKGTITVAATVTRAEASEPRATLTLRISDTGRGMNKLRLTEVRLGTNGPDEENQMSRGIGLKSCRSILDAHGGSLLIESREGEGTEVTVELPVGLPEALPRTKAEK